MNQLKLKRIKPILQLQFPTRKPEAGEYDYRESKLLDICELAKPEWDVAKNAVDLELLHSKQELKSAAVHLVATRQKAKKDYVVYNEKWKTLHQKEQDLRFSFVKFEQFVIENEEKRKRAKKKIIDEMRSQHNRVDTIGAVKLTIGRLIDVKMRLDQRTREYKIYEDFMNRVAGLDSTQFKSIMDVIKRHQILIDTKDEVAKQRAREMDELDAVKIQFAKLVDEKELILINMNSQMVKLISRHEEAKNTALRWENVVDKIRDMMEDRICEITNVKICIRTLYKQMCGRRKLQPTLHPDDLAEQLRFIKKSLKLLRRVKNIVAKMLAKEVRNPRGPRGRLSHWLPRRSSAKPSVY